VPSPRYRLPLGPRISPETFRIRNRHGEYLANASILPFAWTAREPAALAFRSKVDAKWFMERKFVGMRAARDLLGLRVV